MRIWRDHSGRGLVAGPFLFAVRRLRRRRWWELTVNAQSVTVFTADWFFCVRRDAP